jgi:hypothetical protein
MKPVRQINQELFEYALNNNSQFKPQIAQIADEQSSVETIQRQKWTQEGTGIILRRYKIRILSMHDENIPVESLPWAYGQSSTSGLRGESSGAPIYPANTFVTVFQDPDTGIYYIDDVHPNTVGSLPQTKEPGTVLASGFVPGSALFYVPQTHYKDGRLVDGAEWFNTPRPSEEDVKQSKDGEDPVVLPSKCRKVNTEAINSELTKLIKDIQKLKGNLVGKDSFLQTSQNFLTNVQAKISEASSKIANWVSWLIQEIRRFVMRKINATVRNLSGNAPLSSRYLINDATKSTLSIISCLFVKLLQNLERIISQILNAIVDKVINTTSCLLNNLLANLISQIIAQLTSAINGALGTLSSLLGSIISFTGEILDFAVSILDFLSCKVENVCPVPEQWNILEGGQPPKFTLDFTKIFNSAQGFVGSFIGAVNLPENLNDFNFGIDPNFDPFGGGCFVGPESCGPPNVVFWGGSGSGATGNAILNSFGNIIGVDIITPGVYTSAPSIIFEDNCGNGVGAYGIPILGDVGIGTTTPPIVTTGIGTTTPPKGVVGVIMKQTGRDYLPKKDGSKGGMGRQWANRCQTIVRRANGNWDPPYSYEQPIKLFFGDMIQLPGKGEIYIDCDFTESKLPGCIVTGTLTCLKSMIGFDDSRGIPFGLPNIKSMVGFDDIRGSSPENTPPIPPDHERRVDELMKTTQAIEAFEREKILISQGKVSNTFRPDQFGFYNDYPYAKELGFTDQDIRFYIEGFYSKILGKKVGPLMQVVLNDPNFGPLPKYLTGNGGGVFDYENDYPYAVSLGFTDQDIRYYLENFYTGVIADDMQRKLNDSNWGRIPEFYVTITAPDCPPYDLPENDDDYRNNYNVTDEIADIDIEDGGFGFSSNDTATVLDCAGNPDPSAEIELSINQDGTIIGVKVIKSGGNYTCIPEIRLNTKTGYNARLKPILKFTRVSEDKGFEVPPGTGVLNVVDCVGKV